MHENVESNLTLTFLSIRHEQLPNSWPRHKHEPMQYMLHYPECIFSHHPKHPNDSMLSSSRTKHRMI
jgi:hypothetical protein